MTSPATSDATLDLRVAGRGEPRAQLLCLEGAGTLWAGDYRGEARPGTLLSCAPEERHGAEAGDGDFLVLGIPAPSPRAMT